MTYFQLRKHEHDPGPGEVDGEEVEAEDEPEGEPQPTAKKPQPTGWPGAIWYGMSGPWRWLVGHFGDYGVTIAWTIHVGSPWAFFYYRGWVAAGLVLAWPLAFLLFIPREFKDRLAEWIEGWGAPRTAAPDKDPVGGAEEDAPADPRTELIRWLDELTRDRSGIHLKELHRALARHPQLAHLKRAEMRVWLGRHNITVDRTLRVGDVAGRSGVSRATIETLLKDLPPLAESGGTKPAVHAPELHNSPVESGVESGGEHAA